MLIILIIIDMIYILRECIIWDIKNSLQYDFRFKHHRFAEDYSSYQEFIAYNTSKYFDNSFCPLCMNDFNAAGERKQLLSCGHLYHEACLEQYEWTQWTVNDIPYPYCSCYLGDCNKKYHIDTERWRYNEHYIDNVACYLRDFSYPGKESFFGRYLWRKVDLRLRRYSQAQWVDYPYRWDTEYYN